MTSLAALAPVLSLAIAGIGVIAFLLFFQKHGRLTTVSLLPYQRGILYRRGYPVRDVGPGKHRVWAGSELLVHGDMRPITVNYDKLIVGLQDGLAAQYGFSANVEVQNLRKAVYSARNFTNIPHATLLRCARRCLGVYSGKSIQFEKEAAISRITVEAGTRLNKAGFELVSFRLTELAVGTLQLPAMKNIPDLPV